MVTVDGDEIACRKPDGAVQRIRISALQSISVETNDSGPWGIDVWFILDGGSPDAWCTFPLGATGEDAALAELKKLPGFDIRGMNSTANARFVCWSR